MLKDNTLDLEYKRFHYFCTYSRRNGHSNRPTATYSKSGLISLTVIFARSSSLSKKHPCNVLPFKQYFQQSHGNVLSLLSLLISLTVMSYRYSVFSTVSRSCPLATQSFYKSHGNVLPLLSIFNCLTVMSSRYSVF